MSTFSEKFASFIDATELLLKFFVLNKALPPSKNIPVQLTEYLRSPLRVEERKEKRKNKSNDNGENEDAHKSTYLCLVFPLINSFVISNIFLD